MISSCPSCIQYQIKQQKETLIQHDIPKQVWTKVGTDLFSIFNQNFVIVVDYTSKCFEIFLLPNTLSETVINHPKSIFALIPETVISDNGSQFISDEYDKFAKSWGFDHDLSNPEYPQTNGMVERTIQTVKKTLRKAKLSNNDPYLAILALRTTPRKKCSSPAQLLMNQNLRTTLPSPSQLLERSYNRNAKNLPLLNQGQSIQTHQDKSWTCKGIIIESDIPRRSYKILADKNTVIHRNR